MKDDYIDEIILRAVSLDDVELLNFVLSRLSKDTDKDVLKNLANVIFKDDKNVYEYLLENRKNEMLNSFIRLGFWAHVHIAINKKNETMLDMAYRTNNLPIVVSLLGNENAVYNENSEDFNNLLRNVKSNYQASSFLLNYIKSKMIVMPLEYPKELTEDEINQCDYEHCFHHVELEPEYSLEDSSLTLDYDEAYDNETTYDENNEGKPVGSPDLELILSNANKKIKKAFRSIFPKKKESNSMEVENEIVPNDVESLTMANDVDIPTAKDIKERINSGKEDVLKNMIRDVPITYKEASDEKIDFNKDDAIQKEIVLSLHQELSDRHFNSKKEKVSFILKEIINAFSSDELIKYSTVRNFISLMDNFGISVLPKIQSISVSSFEFVFEDASFSLSSLESVSMEQLKNILCIDHKKNLFLINEKIKYLETSDKKGSEYLRLLITKTYLESKSLRDFISKLKDLNIEIETSIKDFSIITATAEELKNLERILTIYKYKKDNIVIDDEDLPESVRYCEIRDSLKNK